MPSGIGSGDGYGNPWSEGAGQGKETEYPGYMANAWVRMHPENFEGRVGIGSARKDYTDLLLARLAELAYGS